MNNDKRQACLLVILLFFGYLTLLASSEAISRPPTPFNQMDQQEPQQRNPSSSKFLIPTATPKRGKEEEGPPALFSRPKKLTHFPPTHNSNNNNNNNHNNNSSNSYECNRTVTREALNSLVGMYGKQQVVVAPYLLESEGGQPLDNQTLAMATRRYRTATNQFNKIFDNTRFPFAVLYAYDEEDVVQALRWALSYHICLSVRSSGHSSIGSSVLNSTLLIDMSHLNQISLLTPSTYFSSTSLSSPSSSSSSSSASSSASFSTSGWYEGRPPMQMVAMVGAGTSNERMVSEVKKKGVYGTWGGCPTVSMGGYLQGGGEGNAARLLGYGIDNVLAVRLLLANTSIIMVTGAQATGMLANGSDVEQLYWGIRGGGGPGPNFGVVLAYHVALYAPPPSILNYVISYSRNFSLSSSSSSSSSSCSSCSPLNLFNRLDNQTDGLADLASFADYFFQVAPSFPNQMAIQITWSKKTYLPANQQHQHQTHQQKQEEEEVAQDQSRHLRHKIQHVDDDEQNEETTRSSSSSTSASSSSSSTTTTTTTTTIVEVTISLMGWYIGDSNEGISLLSTFTEQFPQAQAQYEINTTVWDTTLESFAIQNTRARSYSLLKQRYVFDNPLAVGGDFSMIQTKSMVVCPSEQSDITMYLLGGVAGQVPVNATAYPHRLALFNWNIDGGFDDPELQQPLQQWIDMVFQLSAPYLGAQAYQNAADTSIADWPQYYYAENLPSLLRLKQFWDPQCYFSAFPQSLCSLL